jgi:hypothetical protein
MKSKNKISGIGTTPWFFSGVPLYIQVDVTPSGNEVRFSQTEMFVDRHLDKDNRDKDTTEMELLTNTTEMELLTKICENQDWVVKEQIMQIKELQNQLADYEQELYEKDLYIEGGSN